MSSLLSLGCLVTVGSGNVVGSDDAAGGLILENPPMISFKGELVVVYTFDSPLGLSSGNMGGVEVSFVEDAMKKEASLSAMMSVHTEIVNQITYLALARPHKVGDSVLSERGDKLEGDRASLDLAFCVERDRTRARENL